MAQKNKIISFFFVWCIIINYVNAADLMVTASISAYDKFTPETLTALLGDNVIFKRATAEVKAPLIRLAEADSKDACLRTKRTDAFFGELPDVTTTVAFTPAKVGTYYVFDLLDTDCNTNPWHWLVLTVDDAPSVNATQSTKSPGSPKAGTGTSTSSTDSASPSSTSSIESPIGTKFLIGGAVLAGIGLILGIIAYIVKTKYSKKDENVFIYNEQNTLNENYNQQNNNSLQHNSLQSYEQNNNSLQSYEQNYNQQNYNQQNNNSLQHPYEKNYNNSLQQPYEHSIQAPAPPYNEQAYNNNAVVPYNSNYDQRV